MFPVSGVRKFHLGFDNRFMKNFSGKEVVSNILILFLTFHFSCVVCYCIVAVGNAMLFKFLISQILATFSLKIERLPLFLSFFLMFLVYQSLCANTLF